MEVENDASGNKHFLGFSLPQRSTSMFCFRVRFTKGLMKFESGNTTDLRNWHLLVSKAVHMEFYQPMAFGWKAPVRCVTWLISRGSSVFQARDRLTVEDYLYHMVLNTLVSHFLFVLGCISGQNFDLRLGMILGGPFWFPSCHEWVFSRQRGEWHLCPMLVSWNCGS